MSIDNLANWFSAVAAAAMLLGAAGLVVALLFEFPALLFATPIVAVLAVYIKRSL